MPSSSSPLSSARRALRLLLSVAVVVAIFVGVLPRIASVSDVWPVITGMSALEVLVLTAVAGLSLLTYAPVLMASLPGLTLAQSVVVTQSSTAVANTLPAGGALGVGMTFAMYASWGFRRAASALSVVVTGIWNTLVKLALPFAALGVVAVAGNARPGLAAAAAAGIAAVVGVAAFLAVALSSERFARRTGESLGRGASRARAIFRRPPVVGWGERAVDFRRESIGLLRRRWLALSFTVVVSQLSLYAVLLVTLRNVGVSEDQVGWAEVLAAFAFVRLLSALPITPGGVGVVELGLTAALVAAGGNEAQVVAAALVFRALTYLAPIPFGAVTYVVWRRRRAWRARPA